MHFQTQDVTPLSFLQNVELEKNNLVKVTVQLNCKISLRRAVSKYDRVLCVKVAESEYHICNFQLRLFCCTEGDYFYSTV